jgi:hypothetical protein
MKSCNAPVPPTESALHDAPDLEFPDWSGMHPNRSRKSFAEAVQWNDEMLALFPPRKRLAKLERERRCDVEFAI